MVDVTYVGGKTYIVTRAEGSKATPADYGKYDSAGTDDKLLLTTNYTPSLRNNFIKIYTLGGGRSYKKAVPGKLECSGSFEYDVQNGDFLKYALGTLSSATTATVDFDGVTITGTPTSDLKSYTIIESDVVDSFTKDVYTISELGGDFKHRYVGCKVNQVSMKADTENPLKATIDWVAQTVTTTTGTVAAPTNTCFDDVPKMFYQGQLLIDAGDMGTGTGTLNTLTDSTKSWTVNAFQTNYVVIDDIGIAFPIASNTATALTVVGTPSTGTYAITPKSTYTAGQVVQCNSIDSTLTNTLESYWSISNDTGRGVKFLIEKIREYTLNLDLNFTNSEQLGRFYTGAEAGVAPTTTAEYTPFMVVLNYKTATSDGDNFKEMRIVYDDVVFDETSLPVNPQDILKQTVTAFAKSSAVYYITDDAQT